jgi:hypothetical protein
MAAERLAFAQPLHQQRPQRVVLHEADVNPADVSLDRLLGVIS